MTSKSYLTPSRIQIIKRQLSERDLSILSVLQKFKYASAIQLERLFFTTSTPLSNARLSRRTLKRLTDIQVLQRIDRRIGGVRAGSAGYIYSLDRAGRALNQGTSKGLRRTFEPSYLFLNHTLRVTELYVLLKEANSFGALHLDIFQPEPLCWRPFPGVGRRYLKPDAYITLRTSEYEYHWFIEIDMDTETMPRIDHKLNGYSAFWATGKEQAVYGLFPTVLFLVPTEARRYQIARQIERLPPKAQRLFEAALFSQAMQLLVADVNGADSTQRND